jgi:hypothetical protein
MKRTHWRQFIGLPHQTGADPCTDDAADCLLVAFAVLDELNMPHPPLARLWFALAAEGMWRDLETLFKALTVEDDGADGAVAMTQSGVIVSVGGGVLLTQHQRGVRWVPMELLAPREWRRFP